MISKILDAPESSPGQAYQKSLPGTRSGVRHDASGTFYDFIKLRQPVSKTKRGGRQQATSPFFIFLFYAAKPLN